MKARGKTQNTHTHIVSLNKHTWGKTVWFSKYAKKTNNSRQGGYTQLAMRAIQTREKHVYKQSKKRQFRCDRIASHTRNVQWGMVRRWWCYKGCMVYGCTIGKEIQCSGVLPLLLCAYVHGCVVGVTAWLIDWLAGWLGVLVTISLVVTAFYNGRYRLTLRKRDRVR